MAPPRTATTGRGTSSPRTDALGNTTAYTYDARGNVLTQTATVDGQPQVTRYAYDARGNLTKETDALGHETSYTYDRSGNRLGQTTTRTTPSGVETLVTSHEYDASGRLVKTTDPDGTSTRTVYDALGRQVESHDKLGRKTAYEYDVMGRLVGDDVSRRVERDARVRRGGPPDEQHGPRGPNDTLTSTTRSGACGRRPTPTAPSPRAPTTPRAASWPRRTPAATPPPTSTTPPAAGRPSSTRSASARPSPTTRREPGDRHRRPGQRHHVRVRRAEPADEDDLPARRARRAPPTFTETGYDELGRRVSETDQAGRTTRFEYDAVGRLTAVVDALDQRTSYTYDEQGNRTSQTDANGHVTRFEYDSAGPGDEAHPAPVAVGRARAAAFETKTYDAAGNLETRTDFLGRTTTYAYEADTGRLLSRTYPNPAENVSFTYTATGRRKTAVDARGTTTYDYDVRDRLKSLTYPDGRSLGYDYDPQGNRTKLTALIAATSLVVNSSYDELGRLATVTDPAGRVYTHGYDPNGNRGSLAHPNGAVTAYGYDALNRLTSLGTTAPGLGPRHPELRLHARPRRQPHADRRERGPAAAADARLQLRRAVPADGRDGHGEPRPRLRQDLRLRPRRQPAEPGDDARPGRLRGPAAAAGDDRLRLRRARPAAERSSSPPTRPRPTPGTRTAT